ncbi:MAG: hypothetical protein M1823_003191 [Watsoniomyces obsoletus]|nr:MAG: hypothetical protein M1823_003191 [Watsoniomyces obsoletus]
MTEDDIYRSSTQYRLWSFTPETLASLRASTNAIATDRVRAAIKRVRERQSGIDNGDASTDHKNGQDGSSAADKTNNGTQNEPEIECLTVEEEQKLVGFYCVKAMGLADFCSFPTNVKATAVQFLRRFYLSNSPMTYHPKLLMPCALFLATKTENHYVPLSTFASKVPSTSEDVLAPEFLLTQGLRFTFDVRHPFRGLEGGFMEMIALAEGKGQELGMIDSRGEGGGGGTGGAGIFNIEQGPQKMMNKHSAELKKRIMNAHTTAKELLKTAALLTDAYFLYTPAQIWLSGVYVVDEELVRSYLDVKFPTPTLSSSSSNAVPPPHSITPNTTTHEDTMKDNDGADQNEIDQKSQLKISILSTIHRLARILQDPQINQIMHPTGSYLKELKRIDKKLYTCRNPERTDLVKLNQSLKNSSINTTAGGDQGDAKMKDVGEESGGDGDVGMNKKKRKGSREEDGMVFGPPLK